MLMDKAIDWRKCRLLSFEPPTPVGDRYLLGRLPRISRAEKRQPHIRLHDDYARHFLNTGKAKQREDD